MARAELYGKDVPWWLRMLGCWGVQGNSHRFKWGEFYWKWGFGAGYSVYHEEASLWAHPLIFCIHIKFPVLIEFRPGTEDWNASYGFTWFERGIHFNWRDKCKIVYMPWDWQHVRHSYYWPDGRLHHHAERHEYEAPEEAKEVHPYRYVRRNGEIQYRAATINGEEREWRWKWLTWCPWPRMIQRSINIEFSGEVGERSGSWKGGVTGCSYEWRHGETMEQALRWMENERKFE